MLKNSNLNSCVRITSLAESVPIPDHSGHVTSIFALCDRTIRQQSSMIDFDFDSEGFRVHILVSNPNQQVLPIPGEQTNQPTWSPHPGRNNKMATNLTHWCPHLNRNQIESNLSVPGI